MSGRARSSHPARLPDDLCEQLQDALVGTEGTSINGALDVCRRFGLGHLVLHHRYGGVDLSLPELTGLIGEIAVLDPSLAWLVMTWNQAALITARLPRTTAQKVLGSLQDGFLSATSAGRGTVERVGTDLRLSGQWQYATGAEFASWVLLHAHQHGEGVVGVALPRESIQMKEILPSAGLRATGTAQIEVVGAVISPDQIYPLASFDADAKLSRHHSLPQKVSNAIQAASVCVGTARGSTPWHGTEIQELNSLTAYQQGEQLSRVLVMARALQYTADACWQGLKMTDSDIKINLAIARRICHESVEATLAARRIASLATPQQDAFFERRLQDVVLASSHGNVGPKRYVEAGYARKKTA